MDQPPEYQVHAKAKWTIRILCWLSTKTLIIPYHPPWETHGVRRDHVCIGCRFLKTDCGIELQHEKLVFVGFEVLEDGEGERCLSGHVKRSQ